MTITRTSFLFSLAFVVALPVWTASEENHSRSITDVVGDIMVAQNITDQSDIRCDDVTDNQFEELGDAVMQDMIGNDEQHEVMDNMMGGEGSDSLRVMHINMGQNYLGCSGSMGMNSFRQSSAGPMGGMMGGMINMMGSIMGGMMGPLSFGMGNLVGGTGMMGLGGGGVLVFWVFVIVTIGLFLAWLNRKQNISGSGKAALDILQERYAKGEIDKQEFEIKKKDLTS